MGGLPYVRDAQSNVLGVYEYNGNTPTNMQKGEWTEQHLYGSSRLGMLTPKWDISGHVDDAYQPNIEDHTPRHWQADIRVAKPPWQCNGYGE